MRPFFNEIQVILALEFFTLTLLLFVNKQRRAQTKTCGIYPLRPHMCTLYQIMYALTSFREWSVPDSGSPHTIRQGCAACIGDDHYTQTQTTD